MTESEVNALTSTQIEEVRSGSNVIRFSYSLSDDAEVDNIKLTVSMTGTERILPTSDYDISYDYDKKTIIYNIKRDMTLSVNYVDAK